MSIADTAKQTVTEPIHWMRRYPWAAALLVLVVAVIVVRNSDTIKAKIAAGRASGSSVYGALGTIFGVDAAKTTPAA